MSKGFLTLSERSESKGFAPVLIIILIALGIGGYLLYQKQLKPVVAPQAVVQPTSVPVISPSTSSSETANWKTYTNDKYKISFNNPSNLMKRDGKSDGFEGVKVYNNPSLNNPIFGIDIKILPQTEKVNLKEWLDKYVIQTHADNRIYSIVLGEITPYKKYSLDGYTFDGGGERLSKYVVLQHEKIIVVFVIGVETGGSYKDNPAAETALDQILSTFKFTN